VISREPQRQGHPCEHHPHDPGRHETPLSLTDRADSRCSRLSLIRGYGP
jgi:hypothetical protein